MAYVYALLWIILGVIVIISGIMNYKIGVGIYKSEIMRMMAHSKSGFALYWFLVILIWLITLPMSVIYIIFTARLDRDKNVEFSWFKKTKKVKQCPWCDEIWTKKAFIHINVEEIETKCPGCGRMVAPEV